MSITLTEAKRHQMLLSAHTARLNMLLLEATEAGLLIEAGWNMDTEVLQLEMNFSVRPDDILIQPGDLR